MTNALTPISGPEFSLLINLLISTLIQAAAFLFDRQQRSCRLLELYWLALLGKPIMESVLTASPETCRHRPKWKR